MEGESLLQSLAQWHSSRADEYQPASTGLTLKYAYSVIKYSKKQRGKAIFSKSFTRITLKIESFSMLK